MVLPFSPGVGNGRSEGIGFENWRDIIPACASAGSERQYPTGDLKVLFDKNRSRVLESFEGKQLEPARLYLKKYYQKSVSSLFTGASACIWGSNVDRAISEIESLTTKLKKLGKLTVDLKIKSAPDGADAMLFLANHAKPTRQTVTNSTIKKVYRGEYRVDVRKPKHKLGQTFINLIDDPGTIIECKLVKASNQNEDSVCALK
jgi:hypothetical protein